MTNAGGQVGDAAARDAKRNRGRRRSSPLTMIRHIATGIALVLGCGMLAWLLPAFLATLVAPWPPLLAAVGMIAGIAAFVLLLGMALKRFGKASAATRWLLLAAVGLFFVASPLLSAAVGGSWDAEFLSPRCRTCSGPVAWIPVSGYASAAIVYGAALVLIGGAGWLVTALRSRRERA